MTKTTKPGDAILRGTTYARDVGSGITLESEVSPCVFMYPGYPLQVTVTLRDEGNIAPGKAFAVDRSLTAETATEADVFRLLSAIRTKPCPRCSAPAFDPTTVETNRGGLCESCFISDADAEFAKAAEAEQRQLAARDRRMKGNGMTVRVTAWIHLAAGGDDYQAHWYFVARPSLTRVQALLREAGSSILDDFQITVL